MLDGFLAILQELVRPDCNDEVVTALLRKAVFNPEEWRGHLEGATAAGERPRQVVLAQRPDYTLLLSYWGPRHAGHVQ